MVVSSTCSDQDGSQRRISQVRIGTYGMALSFSWVGTTDVSTWPMEVSHPELLWIIRVGRVLDKLYRNTA